MCKEQPIKIQYFNTGNNKFCFWSGDKAFRPVKKFYELRNFTNTKRPKCSFFDLMNMPTHVKINRKVAFLSSTVGRKSQNIVVPHPSTHHFCRHSLKLLSPTLPKLMNWILLSLPPLSSDPDKPPKFGKCTILIFVFVVINPIPRDGGRFYSNSPSDCLLSKFHWGCRRTTKFW